MVGSRSLAAARVFCIGRNYVDHVHELGNEVPAAPVIFMKPATSLVPAGATVPFPAHGAGLEHEAELVVVLGGSPGPGTGGEGPSGCGDRPGAPAGWESVAGVGLGLDLTLRETQAELKRRGLPWELAKAFEGSAPLGPLVAPSTLTDPDRLRFQCRVNGDLRQEADTGLMIFPVPALLASLARVWQLRAGDVVFTGTPAGVGPLRPGDVVDLSGEGLPAGHWEMGSPPAP